MVLDENVAYNVAIYHKKNIKKYNSSDSAFDRLPRKTHVT